VESKDLMELEFVFKTKFLVSKKSYPQNWKKKQIIDAELENFFDAPKDYIELLIDEDEYEVTIT